MPFSRTPVAAALVSLLALGVPALTAPTAAALPAHPAAAARPFAPDSTATVTVTGEGSASAPPDLAVVGAGVEASAKTSQSALDAQNKAAAALLAAVRAQGVADRDIRTESISLDAVYDHTGGTARLTGYQATQSFSVKVREVTKVGAVVQAVTDATGDAGRIGFVAFDVSDPAPLRAVAREAAHADAHAKAEQYARLSGRRLGRLVSLSEDASSSPRPAPSAADTPGAGLGGVPVAPGEIRATATVTAVYELDRAAGLSGSRVGSR
ncbi:SIMPL domain-containing protein [Streptomyces sp. NBC_01334]|uniref:SIMPL domain-containing protein n=1 Tax=Streptomyces sp. NBC_01334 TaxID=2903827 RepID=UPI002E0FFA90|nr:SIMPL domain-containing protein [Streptomyces sp. NBC_01334]WSN43866.1 SIMPL domain-containing protein [Streptomyces sp. NBC_01334]